MLKIILLSGKIGSGKTTLAHKLIKQNGFELLSFATPLKQACSLLTGNKTMDKSRFEPSVGMSYGAFLQRTGSYLRDLNPNFFCDQLCQKIRETNNNIVVDDLRYPNEIDSVKKIVDRQIIVVRLEHQYGIDDGRDKNDCSEISLDDYTFDLVVRDETSYESVCDLINAIASSEPPIN